MSKTKPPYPAAFREQMVELARAGKSPAELSREFGRSAQSIANWVAQAARDRRQAAAWQGRPEQRRARRARAAAPREPADQAGARHLGKGYGLVRRQERADVHDVYRAREREPGRTSRAGDVPSAEGFGQRLLRLARPSAVARSAGPTPR